MSCFLDKCENLEEKDGQDLQFYGQVTGIGDQGQHLKEEERLQLLKLLERYSQLFRKIPGRTYVVEHTIHTGDHHPICLKLYRVPYSKSEVCRRRYRRC